MAGVVDYEEHLQPGVERVVIAFAGGPQHTYQWGAVLRKLNLSHVLMRDTTQRYHGHGVAGIGDRDAVVRYVRRFHNRGQSVTTVGVSSGAYAALLYGQLAPVQKVVVISPLTGRDVDDFAPEWHHQIIDPSSTLDDLRKYFRFGPKPRVRAFISDDHPSCTLDRQMCTRIGIEDITLVPGYTHGELARGMRATGMLTNVLME